MAMLFVLKNENVRLCAGLTSREFQCRCFTQSCRSTMVSKLLLAAYETFRLRVNIALSIRSGFRCTLHNDVEGGKSMSRHLSGEAIDIALKELLEAGFSKTTIKAMLFEAGFKFVYFGNDFVHADVGVR